MWVFRIDTVMRNKKWNLSDNFYIESKTYCINSYNNEVCLWVHLHHLFSLYSSSAFLHSSIFSPLWMPAAVVISEAMLRNILSSLVCVNTSASCISGCLFLTYSLYNVNDAWCVSLARWTTQCGPVGVCPGKGPGFGGRGRERVRGREEGHTHEATVHPASRPHLESDTASPRAGREKTSRGDESETILCVLLKKRWGNILQRSFQLKRATFWVLTLF